MARVFIVGLMALLLSPGAALAQTPLNPTEFINSWNWVFDDTFDSGTASNAEPTSFSGSAGGSGYDLSWSVTYGSPTAPPEVTATNQITVSGGGGSLLHGSAGASIRFEIRVVQTAAPPVPVSEVPVSFRAHATVESSGGDGSLFGEAQAFFQVGPDVNPLILEIAIADFNLSSGGFDLDETHTLTVDEVVACRMEASALGYADSPASPGTESGTAFVDPIIEVLDAVIPSTNQSYQNYFTVEFSSGYGGTTPTRRTTWGAIKRMYGGGK